MSHPLRLMSPHQNLHTILSDQNEYAAETNRENLGGTAVFKRNKS
jgi:hypothetical protein